MPMICVIIALGDSAGAVAPFANLVDSILENEEPQSSFIHVGDLFDNSFNNDDAQLIQILKLQNYFSNTIIVRGNHDPTETFYDNFDELPLITDICENVSAVAIDSNRHSIRQLTFIKEEIDRRPERFYIIALHHHLQECSSGDATNTFWKAALENILRPQDLVIHGHSHISGDYQLSNGTQVLITSKANKKRYQCVENAECNCDDSASLEYLKIRFVDNQWIWERISI
jgi:predicted phosphodiesterase